MVQAAQIVMAGDASVAKSGNRCVVNQLFSVVSHVFSFALSFIRFSSFLLFFFFPLPLFLSFSSLSFLLVHLFSFLSFPFPYWVHFSHSFFLPSLIYFSLSFRFFPCYFQLFLLSFSSLFFLSLVFSLHFFSPLISLNVTASFQLPFLPLTFPSAFLPILLFLFFATLYFLPSPSFPIILFPFLPSHSSFSSPFSFFSFIHFSLPSAFPLLFPSFQSPLGSNKDKDLKERKKK